MVEINNEVDVGVLFYYYECEDECFYIIEGEVEFIVGGKMFIVRMGDIVFGFCNVLYSYCFLKFIKMLAIISFVGFECMFCEVYNMED